MAKYKELNKKDKVAFWVGAFLALTYIALLGYVIWSFCYHVYYHEWLKAQLQVTLFFLGWFWNSNRKNKKKVAALKVDVATLKATRKAAENAAFMKGWQGGIDFQRRILLSWVQMKQNQR